MSYAQHLEHAYVVKELRAEVERLSGELAQVREILDDRENDITRLKAALREAETFIEDTRAVKAIRAALEGKP